MSIFYTNFISIFFLVFGSFMILISLLILKMFYFVIRSTIERSRTEMSKKEEKSAKSTNM